MDWKQLLAYLTGSVDEELILRNEYLVAKNRILRQQLTGRVHLTDAERRSLAEIGKKLGKRALEDEACRLAAAEPKCECLCRAVGAFGPGGVSLAADLVWGTLTTLCPLRVWEPLSPERPHQGTGNVVLMPVAEHSQRCEGAIFCQERLGGLLKYNDRAAAR
jgi:hypothetical protein